MKNLASYFLLLFLSATIVGCGGLQFSQQSLDQTEKITTDAITLLNKSQTHYTEHGGEAEMLKQQVRNIYTYEQTRKMNQATISMWREVIQGEGNLFALLDLWKANGTLSPAMRDESVKKIQRLLNSIYDLEEHKRN